MVTFSDESIISARKSLFISWFFAGAGVVLGIFMLFSPPPRPDFLSVILLGAGICKDSGVFT